eukprot:scaffold5873_cov105-Isochrysis_galbana.AAC.2
MSLFRQALRGAARVPGRHRQLSTPVAPAVPISSYPLVPHPMRGSVAGVLHGRPYPRLDSIPCVVSAISTTQKKPRVVDGVTFPMFSEAGAETGSCAPRP